MERRFITRNYPITDDRFVVFGDEFKKIKTKLKADYVLKYNSIILSLVEAKAEGENLENIYLNCRIMQKN